MEESWIGTTDPKEKKRIQNRVAQRVHREKLKSRIRQLEEQLESVVGTSIQNETSKPVSPFDDAAFSFAMPGVLPTKNSEPISDRWGIGSNNITFVGSHASDITHESNTAVESSLDTIPQTSIRAQLDSLSRTSVEVQSVDLEWLLTGSSALKPVLEHTQVNSPSLERGQENYHHGQRPSNTSLSRIRGLPDQMRVSGNSGQPAHSMTTATTSQSPGLETQLKPDITTLERLSLLAECSKRLGFSNLNEALSVYYTADLSKSAILSHEQSLNRVKQLPSFLSDIREQSKHWPTWERANYMRETLRSAEDIYAEECRHARLNLRDQGMMSLAQTECQVDQIFQITRILQQEIPNTWALITSIILHTIMPGEPQQPHTILMIMMLLCYRTQDPVTTLGLCQEYLYQHDSLNDNGPGLLQ